jgi:hypothetical protein
VLEAVNVWPGKGEACRKVGATANLDSFCAHRRQRCAGGNEESDIEIKSRNRRRKKMRGPANSLTKKAPYKGLGADSEEKQEPVSDIDTEAVDSLKVLDPNRPIREATKFCSAAKRRYGPLAANGACPSGGMCAAQSPISKLTSCQGRRRPKSDQLRQIGIRGKLRQIVD